MIASLAILMFFIIAKLFSFMENIEQVVDPIHIGNLIKSELQKQDLSISWLARQVHRDASNMNKMLQNPSIHTDLLIRISKVLHHDFFTEIANLCDFR